MTARRPGALGGPAGVKYLDEFGDPVLARTGSWADRPSYQTVGDHGGVRGPDALHNPQRDRPATAPKVELVHGPGCPVCVTPLEMIDRGLGDRRPPGGHLLLLRRHAAGARERTGSLLGQGERWRCAGRLFAPGCLAWPKTTRAPRSCSSASASRRRPRPTPWPSTRPGTGSGQLLHARQPRTGAPGDRSDPDVSQFPGERLPGRRPRLLGHGHRQYEPLARRFGVPS